MSTSASSRLKHHHFQTVALQHYYAQTYQNHTTKHPKQHSIWRPTSGLRLPLIRPLPPPLRRFRRPPCLNLLLLRASRHNSASTRLPYEVRGDFYLHASSLTNHKTADRFPAHFARYNRRFDSTEPQCTSYTCPTRVRPNVHKYTTAGPAGSHITARAMRAVQRKGPLSQLGCSIRCTGLLRRRRNIARSRRSGQHLATD
jgi:hypothetical protein